MIRLVCLDILEAYSQFQRNIAQLLAKDSGFGDVIVDQKDLDGMLDVEKKLAQLVSDTLDEDDEKLHTINE